MKKLSFKRAQELKSQGVTHILSTLKRYKFTTYYKYDDIDSILANGGKMYSCRWGYTLNYIRSDESVKKYIFWSEI